MIMSDHNTTSQSQKEPSLEQMLIRLKEIQELIEQRKVTLSESLPLLEEAYKLKQMIEEQLTAIESRLVVLTGKNQDSTDFSDL